MPTPTFIERKHDLKMLEINDTVSKMRPEWASINWRYINQRVFRIQKAIYKRTKEGGKVHELQRVCTSLFEAKLLAVRRVTQDNSGKKDSRCVWNQIAVSTKKMGTSTNTRDRW